MEPLFDSVEADAAVWVALRDALNTSHALLPSVSWRPVLAYQPPPERQHQAARHRVSAVLDLLEPTTTQTTRAIGHALSHGEWPAIDERSVFFLTIAMEEIVRFLDLCIVPDEGRAVTAFQTPCTNLAELALWFYFQWWMAVGLRRWLAEVSRDEATFYSYFARPSTAP